MAGLTYFIPDKSLNSPEYFRSVLYLVTFNELSIKVSQNKFV